MVVSSYVKLARRRRTHWFFSAFTTKAIKKCDLVAGRGVLSRDYFGSMGACAFPGT